ncbi:hypothetical protein [Candidatus Amarolinea dominans]|uniref:hypothetical protein n=1 Tax=Candidatus Amarolinea dominans TaxID=3140696 RepID=UPI001D3DE182|nr:hypothetical protein [Anaerolineae bacterium]
MKLRAWLAAWWQTILRDLFGEGDEAGADRPRGSTSRERAADDRLNALLAEAQTRLDDLQTQRRAAVARRKRVELAWQAALAEVNRLDAAVDAALLAGEEDQARRHLAARQQSQARVQEWAELQRACTQVLDELTATAQTQEARLLEARRQRSALETWERTAGAVETLTRAQREQDHRTAEIQVELRRRQEQIAQAEDRIAARREVAQTRPRTEESSWR